MATPPVKVPFANDGSFLEQFLKMQEEAKSGKAGSAAVPSTSAPRVVATDAAVAPAEAGGAQPPPAAAADASAAPQAPPRPAVVIRKKSVAAVQVRPGAEGDPDAKRRRKEADGGDAAPAGGGGSGLSAHYMAEMRKYQELTGEKSSGQRPLMK